jgi:hypothetical protein
MRMGKILTNLCVFVLSGVIALVCCEFVARIRLNAADYLSVTMVRDPIYGAIPSARAGFDKLGFRNRQVPTKADIIAIGDSQTYGNAATMENSWPYALGRMIGRNVYNMGLGGYGPNQYYQILISRALNLKPRLIICGLSLTDDFDNAWQLTYGLDHWAYLRTLPGVKVDFDTWGTDGVNAQSWHKHIRVWLSQHSVAYQLIVHNGIGDRLKGKVQIRNAAQLYPGMATSLVLPDKHIEEAFQPVVNLHNLEQSKESVREGMRITFELLKEMNEICKKNHIQFVVVVIPTKDMAFAEYLEHSPTIALSDVVDKLLVNERLAMEQTFKFLTDASIPYIDPLPALQRAVANGDKFFADSAGDMHPNKNGYQVIAEAVAEQLKQVEANKRAEASAY